uniref:Uncharacterized protein n=1 Tax=Micrurus surinamensis TaxID=129470 RepID=A0A2D4PWY6_MICSU
MEGQEETSKACSRLKRRAEEDYSQGTPPSGASIEGGLRRAVASPNQRREVKNGAKQREFSSGSQTSENQKRLITVAVSKQPMGYPSISQVSFGRLEITGGNEAS